MSLKVAKTGRTRGEALRQSKRTNPDQQSFLNPNLLGQLNPKHPLLQLARQIDWSFFEDEFAPLYSHRGKPSKSIRLMVGALPSSI